MSAYLIDWLNLLARWIHLITGIAWIGSSFYFIWLDNSLAEPDEATRKRGIGGQLFSIHAGGFYEINKYKLAPEVLPQHLHWFKWEAYSTWISGFFLFVLMYYVGANTYLIDPSKMNVHPLMAIACSLGVLAGGWLIYDALCKSPLAKNGWVLALIFLAFITFVAWCLGNIFSDRAVFLHMGALMGTCMAANVFFVIMPGQRALVAAVEAGQAPDPRFANASKLRSVHNNYASLPVLFLMISNHYPMTYGHSHAWAVLLTIIVIGAWTRHFFNLRHKGVVKPMILVSAGLATALLAAVIAPRMPKANLMDTEVVSQESAFQIIETHCISCHSDNNSDPVFSVAPAGVMLHTPELMKQWSARILARAVLSEDMPMMNKTGITAEERAQLGQWIKSLNE